MQKLDAYRSNKSLVSWTLPLGAQFAVATHAIQLQIIKMSQSPASSSILHQRHSRLAMLTLDRMNRSSKISFSFSDMATLGPCC